MRKFSGRTDILSPLLQERQKPVKKNSMRLKSSVPPAPFVAFSPRTVKGPRNLFSAGCSQQLRERETSQGEPAPLQCSQSLPTGLLKPGESRARDALPERSFPQCSLHSIPAQGRMCYAAEDRSDKRPLQMLSKGSALLPVPVQARTELQFCC